MPIYIIWFFVDRELFEDTRLGERIRKLYSDLNLLRFRWNVSEYKRIEWWTFLDIIWLIFKLQSTLIPASVLIVIMFIVGLII